MNKHFKYICSAGAFALLMGTAIGCSEEEPIYMAPEFKLNEVSNIMRTTATFSGSISGDLSNIKEYGFQYSLSEDYTANLTENVVVGETLSSSSFDASVSGLEANERYYYRMYASTGASKVFSESEYFQTAASSAPLLTNFVVDSIGENLARFKCTVEDIGDEYLIEYGVGYKTQTDKSYIPIASDSVNVISVSPYTFSVEINGLEPATKYSFRPYAKNSTTTDGSTGSREGYGDIMDRQTESLLSAELTTNEIADGHIGVNSIQVSATLKSAIGSDGVINNCGFCWSQDNANPVITDDTLMLAPVKVGETFSATIKGLSPKTRYYVRSYATNTVNGAERVGYGGTYEITTGGLKTPTVEFEYEENEWGGRDYVFETGPTSIRIKAFIDAKDFDTNTMVEKGLIWSQSKRNITLSEAKEFKTILPLDLNTGAATTIEGTVNDLDVNSSYYIRAYVVVEADGIEEVGYTDPIEFRTNDFIRPNFSQPEVKDVTRKSATLIGKWETGNGTIKDKGFCVLKYVDNHLPELTTEGVRIIKSDDDTFTEEIKNLDFNSFYVVRSYAIAELAEQVDTVYSWYSDLRTEDIERPEYKSIDINVTADSIEATTGILKAGEGEIVERGFYWQAYDSSSDFTFENSEHKEATGTNDSFTAVVSGLKYGSEYRFSSYVKVYIDGDTVALTRGGWYHVWTGSALKNIERVSSGLTSITVKSGINGSGKGTILEKGFIWLKDPLDGYWKNPTFESEENYTSSQAVTDGDSEEFTLEIANLEKNTGYYVRAYAKISCDGKEYYSYSNSYPYSTQDYTMPNFSSMNVPSDSIGFSTAVLQTSFNDMGNLPIVKKGFVVHLAETTSEPALNNKLYQIDVEGDSLKAKLTGLKHYTRYSVRAFATCKVGEEEETTYSGNRTFRTLRPEDVSFNNLVCVHDSTTLNSLYYTCGIAEVPDGEVIEKGFIWRERPKNNHSWYYPTFEDNADSDTDGYTGYQAVESDSLQSYSFKMTGLKPSTTYFVRSYAKVKVEEETYIYYTGTSGNGTSQLSVNMSFDAALDSCVVSGTVGDLPEGVEEFGVCYSSDDSMSIEKMTETRKAVKADDFDESRTWSVTLKDLEANHQYKVGFYFIYNGEEVRLDGEWWFTTKRAPSIDDNVSPGKAGDE